MKKELKQQLPGAGKFLLKAAVSGIALYFVFRKVDFLLTFEKIRSLRIFWFIAAVITFNVSKIISTWRVKAFLNAMHLPITTAYNIRLYYIGAFYNLFLPGSISGDGYKIWLLNRKFHAGVKKLTSVVILDRLSGLVALAFLTCIMLLFSTFQPHIAGWPYYPACAAVMVYPAYYFTFRKLFRDFLPAFVRGNYFSLLSQLLQVMCAWMILMALAAAGNAWDYLSLFMVAAVISVIPFTLGGLGAREAVSALGAEAFHLNRETAVTFALLFFFITAISAMAGLFFSFTNHQPSDTK